MVLFGGISARLGAMISDQCPNCQLIYADDLKDAIEKGIHSAKKQDVLLFSPSSSSFDHFNGFEDRGNQFIDGVNTYVETALV